VSGKTPWNFNRTLLGLESHSTLTKKINTAGKACWAVLRFCTLFTMGYMGFFYPMGPDLGFPEHHLVLKFILFLHLILSLHVYRHPEGLSNLPHAIMKKNKISLILPSCDPPLVEVFLPSKDLTLN